MNLYLFARIVRTHIGVTSGPGICCVMGATLNSKGFDSWFGACFVLLVGVVLFEVARRHFVKEWGQTQEAIEREIKQREAIV